MLTPTTGMIMVLTGLCFAGLASVTLRAFSSGATAYSGTYSTKTARQFEDIFLFIPPRRIAEIGWICAACTALLTFLIKLETKTAKSVFQIKRLFRYLIFESFEEWFFGPFVKVEKMASLFVFQLNHKQKNLEKTQK